MQHFILGRTNLEISRTGFGALPIQRVSFEEASALLNLALEVVNRGAEYLGRMFHSLNQIFDINVFVYGGGITNLGHRFIDRMVASYRHHSLIDQKYPAKFLPSELGDRTEVIGAALLVP